MVLRLRNGNMSHVVIEKGQRILSSRLCIHYFSSDSLLVFDRLGRVPGTLHPDVFQADRSLLPPVKCLCKSSLSAVRIQNSLNDIYGSDFDGAQHETLSVFISNRIKRLFALSTTASKIPVENSDPLKVEVDLTRDFVEEDLRRILIGSYLPKLASSGHVYFLFELENGERARIDKTSDLVKYPTATRNVHVLADFYPRIVEDKDVVITTPYFSSFRSAKFASVAIKDALFISADVAQEIAKNRVTARKFILNLDSSKNSDDDDIKGEETKLSTKFQSIFLSDSKLFQDLVEAFDQDLANISRLISPSPHPNLASIEGIVRQTITTKTATIHDVPKYTLEKNSFRPLPLSSVSDVAAIRIAKGVHAALSYLHSKGLVAGSISSDTVFWDGSEDGRRRQRKIDDDDDDDDSEEVDGAVLLTNYCFNNTQKQLNEIRLKTEIALQTAKNLISKKEIAELPEIARTSFKKKSFLAAPEMTHQRSFSQEIDMWDFGILCLQLFGGLLATRGAGVFPMEDLQKAENRSARNNDNDDDDTIVTMERIDDYMSVNANLSQEAVDSVLTRLEDISSNCENRFITQLFDYIKNCLRVDPKERCFVAPRQQ